MDSGVGVGSFAIDSRVNFSQSVFKHFRGMSILGIYRLVPEAYRQRFRNPWKEAGQTYIEFERIKQRNFDRWIRTLKMGQTYEDLREMIILEAFKKEYFLML